MTNWGKKTYKIINKRAHGFIVFELDGFVPAENGFGGYFIFCAISDPFVDYQVGDYLEIDCDKTKFFKGSHVYDDTSIVRKVSSSSEVTRGQAIADRLIREVNSQPPGKVEFEHRIEHRDSSPERFIYRRNY